jgi:uracil-DNA glycosylase
VTTNIYSEPWYHKIAWSNLYKVAPFRGGNPNSSLQRLQRKYCLDILKYEIEILKPEYVVMLTSHWEEVFLRELGKHGRMDKIRSIKWSRFESTLYQGKDTKIIVSYHPQSKNEQLHSEVLLRLMNKN